jgi:hypothetical protein
MASSVPEAEYRVVVESLQRALGSMEQAPPAYESMGEEALRQVVLTALNTRFDSSTSAEAYRGNGKTDLLVRIDNRVVYVGECKIWSGPAALHEALDQLLGYGTWRDSGLGLIIFVRSVRFTRGVARTREALATHEQFRGWADERAGPDDAPTTGEPVRMRVAQTADPDREAIVTLQFAHLPAERSNQIGGEIDDLDVGLRALAALRTSIRAGVDHGVDYRGSASTAGASPPAEPGSMMRYERRSPEGRTAIDAVPTTEDALRRYRAAGAILPDTGSDGDRVRALIDEAVRWGVEVEAAGGFAVRMDRYPPGMHPFVERLESEADLRIILRPTNKGAWPVDISVSTNRGETSVEMHFRLVEPPEGFDVAIRGHFKNLSLTLALTGAHSDTPQRQQFSWALHPTDAPARDRLAALDFLYATSGSGTLAFRSRDPKLPSTIVPLDETELDADLQMDRAFMADVVAIENWLGRSFILPESVSADALSELAAAAEAIRTGRWRANWTQIEFSTSEVPEKRDDWRANFVMPLEAEILGERIRLGVGRAEIHFDIVGVRANPDITGQLMLTIVPHGAELQTVEANELKHLEPGADAAESQDA